MNKKVHYLSFIPLACFTLFTSINSYGQEKKIVSLEEAITLGVNHSNQIKLDSLSFKIADAKLSQSKTNQLPQVSLSASYLRISGNITPFTVAFPTGNVILNPQILNQSYNALQARQLIWAGGKLKNTNKIAELDKRVIDFDIATSKIDVSYQIASIYYNLYATKQTKKILEANIELLTNQKKDANNYVTQGIILENEVLKIDLAISNLETNLSDIENTILFFKNNLSIVTGLNTTIDIPEERPSNAVQELSLDNAVSDALENRNEIKGLSVREEQATIAMKIINSNYLPTLSGIGSYNYDQPNMRVFPNQETFTGTWYAGVSLNWNLTDLFTNTNKLNESKFLIDKVATSINQVKEGIQIEINADYNNFQLAKQKIEIAKKAVIQATENFRVEQNKFNANNTTATEFLNANALLVNAKINLTTAISNADLAYKKLLKSIN
jgi:outer membrane protein TolC